MHHLLRNQKWTHLEQTRPSIYATEQTFLLLCPGPLILQSRTSWVSGLHTSAKKKPWNKGLKVNDVYATLFEKGKTFLPLWKSRAFELISSSQSVQFPGFSPFGLLGKRSFWFLRFKKEEKMICTQVRAFEKGLWLRFKRLKLWSIKASNLIWEREALKEVPGGTLCLCISLLEICVDETDFLLSTPLEAKTKRSRGAE